jgi:2-C-methyl-D-erythritol 4-phosphate cytidylyltransferase
MTGNIFGIILAGGRGTRMGNAERPKQFLEIGGKPIIIHTIEKFAVQPDFEKIIVLCPKAWIEHTRDLIRKHIALRDRIVVIEGGASRNETLMNAIRYIEENHTLDEDTIIVTHDSVRPFVTRRMIEENIEATRKYGACDTVIPASDTIVESRDHQMITAVPDRAFLYQGQTPQSFHALKLKNLYESLTEEEKAILTDACKIYVIKGEPVHLVDGDVSNIKITYPADIRIAESLIGGK